MALIQTLRDRRLLWPAVMTLAALPILLGLGKWQLDRLAWKQSVMASIAERVTLEPIDFDTANRRRLEGADMEYVRMKVRGRFHHDKERYYYAPEQQRGPGFHVYTPMEVAGGGGVLFVNRGWVPEALKDPAQRKSGLVEGEAEIVGLLRAPEIPGTFTPDNDRTKNVWFWRDLTGMLAAAFENTERPYFPMFLDAEGEAPGGWPMGGVTRIELPNRHLEYAITWFGLAGALAAVFAAYAISRLRGE